MTTTTTTTPNLDAILDSANAPIEAPAEPLAPEARPTLRAAVVRDIAFARLGEKAKRGSGYAGMQIGDDLHTLGDAAEWILAHTEANDGKRADSCAFDLSECKVALDTDSRGRSRLMIGRPNGCSGRWYPMRETAVRHLCTDIGAPAAYLLDGLDASIAIDAINDGLAHHTGSERKLRLVSRGKATGGVEVRAITSARYGGATDESLLDRLVSEFGADARVLGASAGPTVRVDVLRGEDVPGPDGFMLRTAGSFGNGELRNRATWGAGLAFRLVCRNSLLARVADRAGATVRRRHVGTSDNALDGLFVDVDAMFEEADRLVRASFAAFGIEMTADEVARRLGGARVRKVLTRELRETAATEAARESWIRANGGDLDTATAARALTKADLDVYAALAEFTAWDMVNGLTRAAQTDPDRREDVEALGAEILADFLA